MALTLAQKAIDGLLRSAEWLACQTASLALSTAKAATHIINVAKGAVDLVKKVAIGTLDVAESITTDLVGPFDMTRVELCKKFREVINGSEPFTASIDMTILEQKVADLTLTLDLSNTSKITVDIFVSFIHQSALKRKPPVPGPEPILGPVVPSSEA